MTRRFDWCDYRFAEFGEADPEKTIAILPTAAIEQHGPHLPVGTDTLIAEGMLARFRQDCPEDLDVRILPVQSVGKSNEHLWAAGTVTLTAATALQAWTEIGLSVARAGLKKLVIVNSHGGNLDLISILTRELRVQAGMRAVKCQWSGFGTPEGMYSDHEKAFGIHGGDVETSLMLAATLASSVMRAREPQKRARPPPPIKSEVSSSSCGRCAMRSHCRNNATSHAFQTVGSVGVSDSSSLVYPE